MTHYHLVIDFPISGPADAKALTEELPPLMPGLAKVQDDLGTVHFARFMIEGDEKLTLHLGYRRCGCTACRAARRECWPGI